MEAGMVTGASVWSQAHQARQANFHNGFSRAQRRKERNACKAQSDLATGRGLSCADATAAQHASTPCLSPGWGEASARTCATQLRAALWALGSVVLEAVTAWRSRLAATGTTLDRSALQKDQVVRAGQAVRCVATKGCSASLLVTSVLHKAGRVGSQRRWQPARAGFLAAWRRARLEDQGPGEGLSTPCLP